MAVAGQREEGNTSATATRVQRNERLVKNYGRREVGYGCRNYYYHHEHDRREQERMQGWEDTMQSNYGGTCPFT